MGGRIDCYLDIGMFKWSGGGQASLGVLDDHRLTAPSSSIFVQLPGFCSATGCSEYLGRSFYRGRVSSTSCVRRALTDQRWLIPTRYHPVFLGGIITATGLSPPKKMGYVFCAQRLTHGQKAINHHSPCQPNESTGCTMPSGLTKDLASQRFGSQPISCLWP